MVKQRRAGAALAAGIFALSMIVGVTEDVLCLKKGISTVVCPVRPTVNGDGNQVIAERAVSTANAPAEVAFNGSLGEHLVWRFDVKTKKLIIEGYGAFPDFKEPEAVPWHYAADVIEEVVLKGDITSIGTYSFDSCSQIHSITIPSSVTSVGECAFENCIRLKQIEMSPYVETIGRRAFKGCSSLTKIQLPERLTAVAEETFEGCERLKSIAIPSGVTYIGDRAFALCPGLKKVSLPRTLSSVGESAFEGCSGLGQIALPSALSRIGSRAFMNCSGLTSAALPQSVVYIGDSAFEGCGLKTVGIPASVNHIGNGAFNHCAQLTRINVAGGNRYYGSFDGVLCNAEHTTLLCVPGGQRGLFVIPAGMTTIAKEAFYGCKNITGVSIPSSVTAIGASAFNGCSGLQAIRIPAGVTKINDRVFSYCDSLISVELPGTVTSIDQYAFAGCGMLQEIVIPPSVRAIDLTAFDDCTGLTDISVDKNNRYYTDDDGVLLNADKSKLLLCPRGRTGQYEVPESTACIGTYAFRECRELYSVVMSDSVKAIEPKAFYRCPALYYVRLSNAVTAIGEKTFFDCDSLRSVELPESLEVIGRQAFADCGNLTSVVLFSSISEINRSAFEHCDQLHTLYYEGTEQQWENLWKYMSKDAMRRTFNEDTVTVYECGVDEYPMILRQPEDAAVPAGASVRFEVAAEGKKLAYQWYYQMPGDSFWVRWQGKDASSVTVQALSGYDGLRLCCDVWSDNGPPIRSRAAVLRVTDKDFNASIKNAVELSAGKEASTGVIPLYGTDIVVRPGEEASFAVQTEGDGLEYQWYFKKAGTEQWCLWKDHHSQAISAVADDTWDGMQVRCMVIDTEGTATLSEAATVHLTKNTVITRQPHDMVVTEGEVFELSMEAWGDRLSYQWYYNYSGWTSWTRWDGVASSTVWLTPYSDWDGLQVYCAVTNAVGETVCTRTAVISLSKAPVIVSQPDSATVYRGQAAEFEVEAEGKDLRYQWYCRQDGDLFWRIMPGHTQSTLHLNPHECSAGLQLYCEVTAAGGRKTRSGTACLTMVEEQPIVIQPADTVVSDGPTAVFRIVACGKRLRYQWYYRKANAAGWNKLLGRTSNEVSVGGGASWDGAQVKCVVTDAQGRVFWSDPATLTFARKKKDAGIRRKV